MRGRIAILAIGMGVAGGGVTLEQDDPLTAVIQEVEAVHALREGLAQGFRQQGVAADAETFQTVCRPVGQRIRQVGDTGGPTIRQLAVKYRNPANRADPEAEQVIALMERDRAMVSLLRRSEQDGRPGRRYFRRIDVRDACLACHGAARERPAFVRSGYPEDRAFNFAVGDLRGVYAVFLPDGSDRDETIRPPGASKWEEP